METNRRGRARKTTTKRKKSGGVQDKGPKKHEPAGRPARPAGKGKNKRRGRRAISGSGAGQPRERRFAQRSVEKKKGAERKRRNRSRKLGKPVFLQKRRREAKITSTQSCGDRNAKRRAR